MRYQLMSLIILISACGTHTHSTLTEPTHQEWVQGVQAASDVAPVQNTVPEGLLEHDAIGAVVSLLDSHTPAAPLAASDATASPNIQAKSVPIQIQSPKNTGNLKKQTRPKSPSKQRVTPNRMPQKNTPPPSTQTRLTDVQEVPTLSEMPPIETQNDVYEQAKKMYQKKQFQRVTHLLRHVDGGGDGSIQARRQMYLLLLSHQKLKNCQSVIGIGQRLAGQFSGSHEAAEAQFMVGQCQWDIQQRDIAKDTWRQLIASQPQTAAAKRAKTALQQK